MKTKKYRAATMREALESVKAELGEDALVLNTRRVRAGGLLGLGSRELIEVTAEEPPGPARQEKPSAKSRTPPHRGGRLLGLVDDSAASPWAEGAARAGRRDEAPGDAPGAPAAGTEFGASYAPLAARAAAGRRQDAAPTGSHEEERARGVEIAPTAPRIIHRPADGAHPLTPETPLRGQRPAPQAGGADAGAETKHTRRAVTDETLGGEIEKLRAEVRELKFSLGGLYGRTLPPPERPALAAAGTGGDLAVYDSPYFEAYLDLASTGLAPEVARRAVAAVVTRRDGGSASRETRTPADLRREALEEYMGARVRFGADPLEALTEDGEPRAVVFIGPTGVGKTTTLAKLAAHAALRARRRVELITLDTYRIAAVEQLKTYAGIIGASCHVARSVVELEALVRRLSRGAVVLVDTTGKSPHDLADQLELADFLRSHQTIVKCLTLPATTASEDALAAARKFALYGANALALTKLDETTRPGACVRVAAESALPLLYLCAGQRVPEDFARATPESFCELALRESRARACVAA